MQRTWLCYFKNTFQRTQKNLLNNDNNNNLKKNNKVTDSITSKTWFVQQQVEIQVKTAKSLYSFGFTFFCVGQMVNHLNEIHRITKLEGPLMSSGPTPLQWTGTSTA